ncbi:MAG TPA: metal-dependent hydrolase [Terriglobales bacterium]|nr:metal-dependent hydrolase [Terriglobales bacterium]
MVEPQKQIPLNLSSQLLKLKTRFSPLIVALFLMLAGVASADPVEVLWLGHSAFRFTSPMGKVMIIDPMLKKNPRAPARYKDLKALGKVDLILVTHGHGDHIGDLVELAKLTGAPVVTNFELGNNLVALGMLDGSKTITMNEGGTVAPLGPGIKVHMVPAQHSSSIDLLAIKPDTTGLRHIPGGAPVGYVVQFENGFTLYHTGDTDVFGDMALINKFFKPDLALVCIGGHYTMDPEHAAYALRELIRPKQVIPMHYGTYPVINRTPAELKAALGNAPIKVLDVKPGEAVKF